MSRKAALLTTNDVPKYIREIASRLRLTTDYEDGDYPGYTFKLYGRWKIGYENQLKTECEKLIAWSKSWYADAYVVKEHFWYDDVPLPTEHDYGGSKWHKRKAYRQGFRNYIKLVITDPVAWRFERDNYYREG